MADAPGREAVDAPVEGAAVEGSRAVRRNTAALGAGQVFTWSMTLGWTLVVPRLIGADGMGMIATGMAVVAMLQILVGAGTYLYVTREIVLAPERSARLVAAAWYLRLILVPFFAIAVFVWAQLAGYGAHQDVVLYLCGGATAVMLIVEPLTSYFQATERMQYIAIGDSINKASQGLIGIVLALIGFGAIGFGACWVVTAVIVVFLTIRWARRYFKVQWRTTWHDLATVARGSLKYWTGGLFFTVYLWIDTAMLSVMTNPTVVGWYGVPMRLFGTFLIFATIASKVFLPRLVTAFEERRGEFKRLARAPTDLVFAASLPAATAIAVGASPVVHILYGPSYAQAVPVFILLGFTLIPMYLNIMLGTIIVASNRQGRANWLMVAATVFNPALNAVLIPLTQHRFGNGGIGAAIALLATESLIAIAGMFMFGRGIIGISTAQRVGRMALACGGMWLAVDLLRSTGPVLSLAAGCGALVVLAVLVGAVTAEERRQIVGSIQLLTRRALASVPGLRVRTFSDAPTAGREAAPAES
jgi:O-antigen/teichoic acid export membrane protein